MIYDEKDFYSVEIVLLHAISIIQNSKIVHPKSKIRMASEPPSKIQMDFWMEFLNSLLKFLQDPSQHSALRSE